MQTFWKLGYWGFCTDGASNLRGHVKEALQKIAETLKTYRFVHISLHEHSYRSIDVVHDSFPALIGQLTLGSANPKSTSKDTAKACGMMKRMMSFDFLTEVALRRDVPDVLHRLSLIFVFTKTSNFNHRFQGPVRYRLAFACSPRNCCRDNTESRQETVQRR